MKNFFPSRAVSCPVLFCCCSFNLKVKPYNKSFIDQACSVKMAGYWPRSFFAFLWTETKTAKKELDQYCWYAALPFIFYHSRGGHLVFLLRVVFLSWKFSLLITGRTRRCTGCKTPLSEHTFGKSGKSCTGPARTNS